MDFGKEFNQKVVHCCHPTCINYKYIESNNCYPTFKENIDENLWVEFYPSSHPNLIAIFSCQTMWDNIFAEFLNPVIISLPPNSEDKPLIPPLLLAALLLERTLTNYL